MQLDGRVEIHLDSALAAALEDLVSALGEDAGVEHGEGLLRRLSERQRPASERKA